MSGFEILFVAFMPAFLVHLYYCNIKTYETLIKMNNILPDSFYKNKEEHEHFSNSYWKHFVYNVFGLNPMKLYSKEVQTLVKENNLAPTGNRLIL